MIVNVNFAEILVICVVALLLFGPEQLPQIARQWGKITGDLRKVTNSVRREWYNAVYPPANEVKQEYDAAGKALRVLKAEVLAPPPGSRGSSLRPPTHDLEEKTPEASTDSSNTDKETSS